MVWDSGLETKGNQQKIGSHDVSHSFPMDIDGQEQLGRIEFVYVMTRNVSLFSLGT